MLPVRNGRSAAAFRPLSPGRLCSTRARAASVQLRAGSSRGRRPWPGGGALAADPAEHRGRRHARAAVPPSSLLFFLARSRACSALRPRDIDELTRGTTASQRWASASAEARGRCVRERRRRATRVVCRRPPGRSWGATAAGNQVARRRHRNPSPVAGLLLRA